MQNSLSVIKDEPYQLEFDFEGYDTELLSKDFFAMAETITLNAITGASTFTDLFEDARCISRIYDNNEEDRGLYYVFRAHDAVTGRNIAVKATNPLFCEAEPKLKECIKWESAVLQKLKGSRRLQQIFTPLNNAGRYSAGRKKLYFFCFFLFFNIYGHRCTQIFF